MQIQSPGRLLWGMNRQLLIGVAIGGTIAASLAWVNLSRLNSAASSVPVALPTPTMQKVTALGRLEPKGEVIRIAPSSQGSRIVELRVKQGDRIQAGQILAVLDSRDRLQAALRQAQMQVQVAQSRLGQVRAGAKTGEISAQSATVTRLQAELNNAESEYRRYQKLYGEGAISASLLDSKRLVVDTTQAQIRQAEKTLQSIAEVRPVDVQAAQADVERAIAAVGQAQAELDLAYIRAPRAGQILKIHTWPGEIVGDDGIVELGQTGQMDVVAEVYESDVQHLKLGQRAIVTSSAFSGQATGTIADIGLQIRKRGILDTNPTADADGRVVEVKIRLDKASSQKVAGLTNLEAIVQIDRGS